MRSGLLVLPVLLALLPSVARAEDGTRARRNFLGDRDVLRLQLALEELGTPTSSPERRMVSIALGKVGAPEAPTTSARGRAALPDVMRALHALDLVEATRAAARADTGDGGMAGAWAGALVRMRRGDDAGAVGRLLAPPLFDWARDAFPLALLGAALPMEDRLMLAAIGHVALGRAAARGRSAAIGGTVLALAALDAEAGGAAFVRGIRALRRAGDLAGAERLFQLAPSAGVSLRLPSLALEGALTAWALGDQGALSRRLAGVQPPRGAQSEFLALRRAGRRARTIEIGGALRHVTKANLHAELLVRFAKALGRSTHRDDVFRWASENDMAATGAGAAPGFLASLGFHVLPLAGDPAAAEKILAAGYPFLFLRYVRVGSTYQDAPVLVRGLDRRTGLWLVDEPNLDRLDVVSRATANKARMLCAVPKGEKAVLDALARTPAAQRGREIQAALARADGGDLEGAADMLRHRPRGTASVDLYLASLLHRRALTEHDDEFLGQARVVLERSRRFPPLFGFEEYARGQALIVSGDPTGGMAALDLVERVEGPSATVAMVRYGASSTAGDLHAALAALDTARKLTPLDARVLFYRGLARSRVGQRDGARADLTRALRRRPDAARVAVSLAALEREEGRPAAALRVLREAVRHAPALADEPVLRAARRAAEIALVESAATVSDLQVARRSVDPETRRRLAFALAEREAEGDAAETSLRKLLADVDPAVRISTLRLYMRPWLRRRVESDAVLGRRICSVLARDEDPGVRAAAAALLARVSAPFSMRALAVAVRGRDADTDAAVRSAVIRALGAHDARAVRAHLVGALEDQAAAVRRAAIGVLFERTATRRGFDPDGTAADRAEAVERWRAWLDEPR